MLCIKEIKRGKTPRYVDLSNTLVFAQKCNTKAGSINISIAKFLDETILKKYDSEDFMQYNDISKNNLIDLQLLLPPLAEQKRIVNTIEELFAQIDKIAEQIS